MTLLIAPLLTAGIAVGGIQNSYANFSSNPTADPNGPYNGELGSSIMFDGSGSSDPDGDALTFDWDFGDANSGTTETPTHTYATVGEFQVCLTVDDGNAAKDTACTTAKIVDTTPPTIICPIDITLNTGEDTSPANTGAATATDDPNPDPTPTFSDDVSQNLDGTKMFVVGDAGDDINEYTLSTAFDVSTAFFVDSFSVAAQETLPTGLAFSSDGAKMFVVGIIGDDVNEYTLTTPFDVSTAFFVDSISVAGQETVRRTGDCSNRCCL